MAVITASAAVADLRTSGHISARALREVVAAVRPGVSTAELNRIAEQAIMALGARPAFRGYQGFPAGLCTSINDEVVHGIPSADRILRAGDIIGLDIGAEYHGLFSDHAVSVAVGQISAEAQRLLDDTAESLRRALRIVRTGVRVGDIGAAVQQYLEPKGYGIVTQLTGHGLGYSVHEPPTIPNVGRAGTGVQLATGSVIAIEPMVTLGSPLVETKADGWTVVTADHRPAAHFEHTVLVMPSGCEILTVP